MIRAAVIVSGDGPEIQNLLDGNYFHEVPGLEIAGVVATGSESGALLRAKSANVPAYCVDSAIFPNAATFTRALLTKLQDIDALLAVLVAVSPEPGESFYREYSGRCVCLHLERDGGSLYATAILADADGSEARRLGSVSVPLVPGETAAGARRRLAQNGAGELLTGALKRYMRECH